MRRLSRHCWHVPLLVLCAVILFSIGCVKKDISTPDPFFQKWQEKAKKSKPYVPKKRAIDDDNSTTESPKNTTNNIKETQSEQPPSNDTLMAKLPTKKISVRFVGDTLPSVLRTLARLAEQNILISPGVQGTLDTHIENTPWNTVFMGIIESYGFVVKQENNLLQVLTYDDLNKQLQNKKLQDEENQIIPLVTKIITVKYSDPEKIAKSLRKLLTRTTNYKAKATSQYGKTPNGKRESSSSVNSNVYTSRGSISEDKYTNSLIIRDTAENVKKIVELVYELDRPIPQIHIKAYIVETTRDTARELGITWDATTNSTGDLNLTTAGNFIKDGGTLGLISNVSKISLDMQLSALQKNGSANILSTPSIATLDNYPAKLTSGTTVPYATTDKDGNPVVNNQEAKLVLNITPHVISTDLVRLKIQVTKKEVDATRSVGENPFILEKTADTLLLVQNKATVVIAGLTKENNSENYTGIPILKEIPVLGHFFRSDSTSNQFEDLLIFITPTILNQ